MLFPPHFPKIPQGMLAYLAIDFSMPSAEPEMSVSLDAQRADVKHELVAFAKNNICRSSRSLVFHHIFFSDFRQNCVFEELASDEHVHIFHVDCGLPSWVDRLIRRDHCRGKTRQIDRFPNSLVTNPSCSSYAWMPQNQQSNFCLG